MKERLVVIQVMITPSEQKLSPSTHAFDVRPTTVEEIQLGGRLRKRIG